MPLFSAFTPFNMLKFSGAPSRGESIYRSMCAAKSKAFNLTKGGYQEAKTYAQAMGIARGRYALERAENQLNPFKCIELLPGLEKDWAVIPTETDTLLDRQAHVAAKMILVRGARREAIEEGLMAILGSHFVALRAIPTNEVLTEMPNTENFSRPDLQAKYIRLTTPVTLLGAPYEVEYANADPLTSPVTIIKGDIVTMTPENSGLKEVVTVASVSASGKFTATFTKAHDIDSFATTDNYVDWVSTQRMFFVVVDNFAALGAEVVRRVDDFMGRVCRGVTIWHIIQPSTPLATTIGPFTLNISPLGAVPIGTLNILPPEVAEFSLLQPPSSNVLLTGGNSILTSGGTLYLYGRHLRDTSDVKIGATSIPFTVMDDYSIQCTMPATFPGGTFAGDALVYAMSVVTPAGTKVRTGALRVISAPLFISSISPDTGPNTGGTAVLVLGTGFLRVTDVAINGFSLAVQAVIDDNTITCTTDSVGGPGTNYISVYDPTPPETVLSPPFLFT